MQLSYFWSKPFLLNKWMLWALLWVNGLGTIYGYEWYRNQLVNTYHSEPAWLLPFVPDSPTASLFFTLAIAYLLRDDYVSRKHATTGQAQYAARYSARRSAQRSARRPARFIRGIVEAFAVITSIKYGIWAVAMIALGTAKGDPFQWQHGMLTLSHLGMVAEAVLFARFFTFRGIHIVIVAAWTLCNDVIDYTFNIYPYLSFPGVRELLPKIKAFTMMLSALSIAFATVVFATKTNK